MSLPHRGLAKIHIIYIVFKKYIYIYIYLSCLPLSPKKSKTCFSGHHCSSSAKHQTWYTAGLQKCLLNEQAHWPRSLHYNSRKHLILTLLSGNLTTFEYIICRFREKCILLCSNSKHQIIKILVTVTLCV